MTATGTVDRYARLTRMIATDQCVILDGANGTELIKVRGGPAEVEEHVWGLTALLDAPEDVARVHRSYIDVGCDVVCTNT
jgi:S-methylmethionine-dependent homocysteine/selenocysteine methylase